MAIHMWDGAHRLQAARKVLEEFGMDLPVSFAVSASPDITDAMVSQAMLDVNERVPVPEVLITAKAKQQFG